HRGLDPDPIRLFQSRCIGPMRLFGMARPVGCSLGRIVDGVEHDDHVEFYVASATSATSSGSLGRSSIIAVSSCARVKFLTFVRSAPRKIVPFRIAFFKFAPRKIASVKFAPLRFAPSRLALLRSVPRKYAP